MTVTAKNSKKVFILGTKEILIMVCVDLSRLRRGKTHNKAEKLDMFNKYCCSLFVKKRCDVFIVHVQKRSAIVNREGVEQRLGSGRSIFQPARTDGAHGGVLQGMDGFWVSLYIFFFFFFPFGHFENIPEKLADAVAVPPEPNISLGMMEQRST